MSFQEFFQDNIIFFMAATSIAIALIFLELKNLKTKHTTHTCATMTQAINAGALLIDLRSQEDFNLGHIAGAKNIPFDQLTNQASAINNKEQSIVLYCYKGVSSGKAVAELHKQGFSKVSHLTGGINAWLLESLPVDKS